MAFLSKLVPAHFVLTAESGDVLRRSHQREVRRIVSQIVKERLLVGDSLINVLERIRRPEVRAVPVITDFSGIRRNLLSVVEKLQARFVHTWAGLARKIQFA